MPGTNLTREEAQRRAALLTVDAYEIDLDLSGAQEGGTYRSETSVRFECAEEGAETFVDLVAPAVHEVVLNGRHLDVASVFRDSRITLKHLKRGANELRVVADCAYTNTGEACTGSWTRWTARRTCTRSSRCRTRGGCSPASSSRT